MKDDELAAMLASAMGNLGVNSLQIGSKVFSLASPPKELKKLSGYGDTIKKGDIFYSKVHGEEFKGPYKMESILPDDGYTFICVDGSKPMANYKGPGWKRRFKLADKETTKKVNAALKYDGMYLRLYCGNGVAKQPILVSACWIAWVGDLEKAITTYDSPWVGIMKRKHIVKWVKSGFYTSLKIKSKVPIPADFPVKIS